MEVLSEYNGKDKKITVRCKIHDYTYETTPHRLVQGANCKYCYNDRRGDSLRHNINDLMQKLNMIDLNKYIYPNIENEYRNNKSKITVICPIHGEFKSTTNKLLKGCGCPYCDESHNEKIVARMLNEAYIKYEREKNFKWLGLQTLDFYLPDKHIAIEIQGEFHFKSKTIGNTFVDHRKQVRRDEKKKKLCEEHGINIIYIVPTNLMNKLYVSDIYNNENVIEINNNEELVGKTIKMICMNTVK